MPDPVLSAKADDFEAAFDDIAQRVGRLATTLDPLTQETADEHPHSPRGSPPRLAGATTRLAEEFRGTYGAETVERFLYNSYDKLRKTASVTTFLPLLAERFARQRLQALAKMDRHGIDGCPTVLFVCVHDAGRSPMTLGFFRRLVGDAAVGWSGGFEPGPESTRVVVQAMKERGIDIAEEFPKPWTEDTVRAVRDQLEERVQALLADLHLTPHSA